MIFKRSELPIAYTMIDAAKRLRPRRDGRHHYEKFYLLWTAFNQIYETIASRQGLSPQLVMGDDGTIETYINGNVKVPKVISASEREQIHQVHGTLDDELKHTLITHESTKFFLKRIPYWEGAKIEHDAFGQRVNGVINVSDTTSVDYPVWSPLDFQVYESYLADPENEEDRDFLTRQIVDLLYTVRKNLMHLGRKFDDANDFEVIKNALPLLELIVGSFTR